MAKYAGFWRRLIAAIIDGVLVNVALLPISFAVNTTTQEGIIGSIMFAQLQVLSMAVSWLYGAFMESSKIQATIGKMLLGMKVTDYKGKRISFLRATGRHFAKYLSAAILGIGYLMIAFTKRKQGLHDILAQTYVVKK